MIRNKIVLLCLLLCLHLLAGAQTPAPVKWLLQAPYMRGASFSLVVKDVQEGRTVYSYDTDRLQSPASVLKTVATATALVYWEKTIAIRPRWNMTEYWKTARWRETSI